MSLVKNEYPQKTFCFIAAMLTSRFAVLKRVNIVLQYKSNSTVYFCKIILTSLAVFCDCCCYPLFTMPTDSIAWIAYSLLCTSLLTVYVEHTTHGLVNPTFIMENESTLNIRTSLAPAPESLAKPIKKICSGVRGLVTLSMEASSGWKCFCGKGSGTYWPLGNLGQFPGRPI